MKAGYPQALEHDVVLDGARTVHVRPVRPDDAARLRSLYDRLSELSAYQRFFTLMPRLPHEWAQRLATVDYDRRLALVAEAAGAGEPELVAVARYDASDEPGTAEIALVVQDAWQGEGLGSRLLEELLAAAEARGLRRFHAYVLRDNARMLRLLSRAVDVEERAFEGGVVKIVFRRREKTS